MVIQTDSRVSQQPLYLTVISLPTQYPKTVPPPSTKKSGLRAVWQQLGKSSPRQNHTRNSHEGMKYLVYTREPKTAHHVLV